jgi:lipopolysaccharide exporter
MQLRSKMAAGALWMVTLKMLDRGIGLISTIVLARLLVPEDFGIVAMATSVLALLELLSTFGFDIALIRQPDIQRSHYDTAWTLNCILEVGMAVALAVLAYPAARYYGDHRVAAVALVLALGPLAQAFENIGIVNFRREMNFRKEFIYLASKRVLSVLIALPLAFALRSYWALVIGTLAGRIIGTSLSYVMEPYRPRFSLAERKTLLGFSQWILFISVLQYLLGRSSDWILGRMAGSRSLGVYNMSFEIASLPASELVAPINRAVYPAYVQIASYREALGREYLTVIGLIAAIALPAAVGLVAVADRTVPLLLGPNWLDAIPLIELLAIAGSIQVLRTNTYSVYLAVGMPRYQVWINGVHVALLGCLMIALIPSRGAVGAAVAYLVAMICMVPVDLFLVCRVLHLLRRSVLAVIWRPAVAAVTMYGAVRALGNQLADVTGTLPRIAQLLALILVGAVTYALVLAALWVLSGRPHSAERSLLDRTRAIARRIAGFGFSRSVGNPS